MQTATSAASFTLRPANLLWAAPAAGAIAALANAGVYFAAKAVNAIPDTFSARPGEPFTVVPVIVSSILPALVGGLVLWLLIKFTRRPLRIFRIVAVVLTLVSLASPFSIPGVSMSTVITLNIMHVVVAILITSLLCR